MEGLPGLNWLERMEYFLWTLEELKAGYKSHPPN